MKKKTKIISLCVVAVIVLAGIITLCCTLGGNDCEHEWELQSDTATCENAGTATYVCSLCGKHKNEVSEAVGHKWEQTGKVAATCTEAGEKTYTCTRCKNTKTEKTSALGHQWKETNNTATCTTGGVKTYTCNVCNETKTENSSPLGHFWQKTGGVAATCTESGENIFTCTRCNETKTEKIPPLGHTYNSYGVCKYCAKFKYNINIKNKLPETYSYINLSKYRTYSECEITAVDFAIQDGYLVAFFYGSKTYDFLTSQSQTEIRFNWWLRNDSTALTIAHNYVLRFLVVGEKFGDNGYCRVILTKISNLTIGENYTLIIGSYGR